VEVAHLKEALTVPLGLDEMLKGYPRHSTDNVVTLANDAHALGREEMAREAVQWLDVHGWLGFETFRNFLRRATKKEV
jgi:hypothetical protein